jgi:5-methylcytosine-specific restriction endonuclease McrA
MAKRLATGCSCGHDVAVLCRRYNQAGARLVALQCQQCGVNLALGMKRADHPNWALYPCWDEEKNRRYWSLYSAQSEARWQFMRDARAAEAAEFYQSDKWRALRDNILARNNYHCEVCGKFPAHTAHHTTYQYGLDAPPDTLMAVCDPCHKRLHTLGDPLHDPGAVPAHYVSADVVEDERHGARQAQPTKADWWES